MTPPKTDTLSKNFNPDQDETALYQQWEQDGCFTADAQDPRPPYTIVIPPPNVTGALHMGHAFEHTLQDMLIRFKRMDGFAALWLPGTDHAGIATQNVVERDLENQGLSKSDMTREDFVERVWDWKKTYGDTITQQIRRMGSSCDWSRMRFTLDEGLSKAVRHVFVTLYEEGLIYRSSYLVNWDPKNQTAISDLEVEFKDIEGTLTHFTYPLVDGGSICVATTRPETMLGDTAIAVHPDDARYKNLIGKKVQHPFADRTFTIIGDDYVKPEFGTGAVKITPAHDPNDYEMGLRNQLDFITVIGKDGCMNELAGRFAGLDRFEARKQVVQALKDQGLLVKQVPHMHSVGHSQRSGAVIEPLISKQWFVKMKDMAADALQAVEDGKTNFAPSNWTKTYTNWLQDIRDWCISRQLWWGHRIPVWYCQSCEHMNVSMQDPTQCSACKSKELVQDPDVLDTWFSSALWPFSTMGWPDQTPDFKKFFPTQVLVTGFDIIFFWVARMMMMSLKFTGQVPFKTVHIHALIRDEHGQKMSKSKGNVVDPLVLIDQYGADAFRFGLCALAVPGRDILLSEKRIEGYRNFINKIWNAAKFIEHACPDAQEPNQAPTPTLMANQWIMHRLHVATAGVRQSLDDMRFHDVADHLYKFAWHEFCDWYLELAKVHLYSQDQEEAQETASTLLYVYHQLLKILHPVIPFVTEKIWQHMNFDRSAKHLMLEDFPKAQDAYVQWDDQAFSELRELISAIRAIRTQNKIPPSKKIAIHIWNAKHSHLHAFIKKQAAYIESLASIESIDFNPPASKDNHAYGIVQTTEFSFSLDGLIDHQAELARIQKERAKIIKDIAHFEDKMKNPAFIDKAPAPLIEKTKQGLALAIEQKKKLDAQYAKLEGS